MARPLPISFLSDYGLEDDFVGVCHGVIQRLAPGATVIDVAHNLPRHGIRPAAVVLRNTLPYLPAGVHLAVVDPGVGGERRAVALRVGDGRFLVGPDNGVLSLAAERLGVEEAVDLETSPHRLEPVSATFHGRDLFAPVAAALALGADIGTVGRPFPPSELTRLELPAASVRPGEIVAHAVYVDRFGNVQLDLEGADMGRAGIAHGERLSVEADGHRAEALYARTFGDVPAGGLLAYADSYGAVALAVNGGSAAEALGIELDRPLRLERAGGPA